MIMKEGGEGAMLMQLAMEYVEDGCDENGDERMDERDEDRMAGAGVRGRKRRRKE